MRFGRISPTQFARITEDGRAEPWSGAPWLGASHGMAVTVTFDALYCPVEPTKILCVGRNYAAHAKELGNEVPKEPLLFLKPTSSLVGPNDSIVLPKESERVEHEVELGVIIGKLAKRVSPEEAMDYVFGYTCAGDITARDLQKKDGQWSRAKGFDTFCPVGPWIETDLSPDDLSISCTVNGETRQKGRTSAMMFSVPHLISYMSHAMTLMPGDLLLTGTPEGVGPLHAGDTLKLQIEKIGELSVSVRLP